MAIVPEAAELFPVITLPALKVPTCTGELELNFKKGFTVLTGETGAGKSIIVDAINLLLGNRADRRLIKKGQNEASVSALFSVKRNHEVINILTKYGLVAENEIIIRKHISNEVVDEYLHLEQEYTQKCIDYDESDPHKLHFTTYSKRFREISLKLRKSGFKDELMKECRYIFNNGDFYENLDSNKNLIGFENGVYNLEKHEFCAPKTLKKHSKIT